MTLPWYPPELPAPLRQSFQIGRGEARSQFRTDAGPPLVRPRYSAVADLVTFSTLLYRHEMARFDRFYLEETKKGSLPFLLLDPSTDGWPAMTDDGAAILTDDGTPVLLAETWLCLFGQRLPVVAPMDMAWQVSFDIAVMP